jgi:hypothetical protein
VDTDGPRHAVRGRPRSRGGVLVYGTYPGQWVVGAVSAILVVIIAVTLVFAR